MKITIDISNRLYHDIQLYCDANKMDFNEYIVEMIRDKHSLNKFGDLNELLPKVVEETKVEVKKRGRKKKEVTTAEPTTQVVAVEGNNTEEKIEEVVKDETVEVETMVKPTAKRKRTLKTK